MSVLIAILVIVVLILVWAVAAYNSLVRLRNKCDESEAAIDAHLKQRYDLVPNLVETVKGYAAHESSTLESVIEARNKAVNASDPAAKAAAEDALTAAVNKLFALSEAYPDLKANQNFSSLQTQLEKIESEILSARKYYNANARIFNDKIMVLPSSVIAGIFKFTKRDYIAVDEAEKERVEVKF